MLAGQISGRVTSVSCIYAGLDSRNDKWSLELLNKLGGVGANFVAVKDMEASQAIHGLAGKARKRD